MADTTKMQELFQIINGTSRHPHRVLGMHPVEKDGKKMLVVRAFVPGAEKITVVDAADSKKRYEMERIHPFGLFEVYITNRSTMFAYRLTHRDWEGNRWSSADPYAFLPTLTEYDRYLFGQGTHYKIYEKLGAHPMEINGVKGVAFAVWAPNAQSVSVIGSFNNWNILRHPMRVLAESGIWELFIPKVCPGDTYKFHILGADGSAVDKADPYAFFSEVRPQTASVVTARAYRWGDKKWMDQRKKANPYRSPMNIYEVHLGSWMQVQQEDGAPRSMTYLEIAEHLIPYMQKMGYTHVEFLPLMEHPFDGSWGYQVTGYYAVTSRYGTPKEFKTMVDAFHKAGIGVILDWVPAHFPKDDFGLGRFDGTPLYEHPDPRRGEQPQWGTYVFNYGKHEVSNFLIANALFWLEEYHIDGLRVDAVASMLYLDFCREAGQWAPNEYGGRDNPDAVEFIKHMNSVIMGRKDGSMMIAEESTAWPNMTKGPDLGGLGFTFKWNMGWMNDYLAYLKLDPIYRKYHHNDMTFSLTYAYSENYILALSHDEVVHGKSAMIGKMGGSTDDIWQKYATLRLAYGYMFGHPGKKLLFMGGEFAQFHEWNYQVSLDWHLLQYADHQRMQHFVETLNHFYLSHPALWEEDCAPEGFTWIECDDKDHSVFIFSRQCAGDELVFVCNFTPETVEDYRIGVPHGGKWIPVLSSDAQEFGGSGVVNMGAQEAQEIPANRCQMSIPLRLAPLSVTVYAPEEMPHKEKKTARSRKVKAQAEAKDKTEAKIKVNTKTAAKTKAEPNTESKKKSSSGEKTKKS